MIKSHYFNALIFILILKMVGLALYIAYSPLGLGPDEAQYWTWSQDLAFGYYSKPPGIAWLIRLFTTIFGNTELGVRAGSLVLGFFTSLSIYGLAIAAGLNERTAYYAGLIMTLTPLGLLGSLLAITDSGLFLFWTLAMIVLVKALKDNATPRWELLGLAICGGALFKWPIYWVWAIVAATIPFKRHWINKQLGFGVLISLLGLLPSLIWNMEHDWATFKHVGSTIQGGAIPVARAKGNPGAFIGEQFLLLSPLLFGMVLWALPSLWKRRESESSILFCGWTFFIILGSYFMMSFFQKMQGNWSDFIYPTGIVFLAWYWNEVKQYLLNSGIAVGALLSFLILICPFIDLPYKLNPFKSNLGWDHLTTVLENEGYNPDEHFLVGDKYQTSSILSFYGPAKKRAYFLNLGGTRKNQFSFWPSLADEQMGKSGYFVVIRDASGNDGEKTLKRIRPYFDDVQFIGERPLLFHKGKPVKVALIYKASRYNGKIAEQPDYY